MAPICRCEKSESRALGLLKDLDDYEVEIV